MAENQLPELLAQLDRAIAAWPGVETVMMGEGQGQGGFWVPPGTSYRLGGRELGHIHVTGEADLPFTRVLRDRLIAEGRAHAHAAGFPGVVTREVRGPDDLPAVLALFRMNYDRAQADAARRHAS
jgi:hypothetical protein